MAEALLILPHQLFHHHPGLDRHRPVYLWEEQLFLGDWRYPARFHKQKALLHRASLRAYGAELAARGFDVRHVEYAPDRRLEPLFARLAADGADALVLADPVDFMVEKRLRRECAARGLGLRLLPTPAFLCPEEEFRNFFAGRATFRQADFYAHERRRLGVLLTPQGGPAGGKWSFDAQNRRRLPPGVLAPTLARLEYGPELQTAKDWVERRFPANPGGLADFHWPVTRGQARQWLKDFLDQRLADFGPYEDAMSRRQPVLFHSALACSLNVGLLTPREVLDAALAREGRVPMASLEGFVRQVMGWREYVRAMYVLRGTAQRTAGALGCARPMPRAFYDGATSLPPFDEAVARLRTTGYAHHIERLMVLGNLMLLCEVEPTAVYTWFMELFIDAYDWVMVPNVYAMSQFADGGAMMSKPYVSGSAYILRMSDHPRGPWCRVWDGLFWRFVHRHAETFRANPRTALMAAHLRRMDAATLNRHLRAAEDFLEQLQ